MRWLKRTARVKRRACRAVLKGTEGNKCVQVFGPSHTVCVRVPSFSGTAVACFPTWLVVGGTAVAAWMEGTACARRLPSATVLLPSRPRTLPTAQATKPLPQPLSYGQPEWECKVRAWFMRHNKPGGFCVYKTALSFSTGAGLAHPAAMRAPLFYLPRASGAQNLVCLTARKIFTVVGPAARVSSSTSLDL